MCGKSKNNIVDRAISGLKGIQDAYEDVFEEYLPPGLPLPPILPFDHEIYTDQNEATS